MELRLWLFGGFGGERFSDGSLMLRRALGVTLHVACS